MNSVFYNAFGITTHDNFVQQIVLWNQGYCQITHIVPCQVNFFTDDSHMGKPRIIAETGAGQHGVASATVAARYGMECVVYMGSEDVKRQAQNVYRMKLLGASVVPVESGSKTLKDALNEAMIVDRREMRDRIAALLTLLQKLPAAA